MPATNKQPIKEVQIDPITIAYTTEDGKKHVDVVSKAYQLVKNGKQIKMQATREQLVEAANKLLGCFQNVDKWPQLSVAISGKTWYVAAVDDTTRDAIRRLGKLTGVIKSEPRR